MKRDVAVAEKKWCDDFPIIFFADTY